jgi:hypothetical protein
MQPRQVDIIIHVMMDGWGQFMMDGSIYKDGIILGDCNEVHRKATAS